MSSKLFEDLLRIVVRSFYDEVSVVVMEYILRYGQVEEHRMADDLNLPFNRVRQALLELQQHEILTSKEGKRDRRHEEKTGNMFTRGPDMGKMVYWTFDSDIKNVILSRLISLRNKLDQIVEDAKKIVFWCAKCGKQYSIEEAMPLFKCLVCPDVDLTKEEKDIEAAKEARKQGLEQIEHIQRLLGECLHVSLPSSFFGIYHEGEPQEGAISRKPREKRAPVRGIRISISLPEEEIERKNINEDCQVDPEILKYYQKIERRQKRREKEDFPENGTQHSPKNLLTMPESSYQEHFTHLTKNRVYL